MQTMIRKWENSTPVRMPVSINKIILEPISDGYDLSSLLSAISPENLHSEIDFGEPVGKEF